MSLVDDQNMTSSVNDTPVGVTYLLRHPVPTSLTYLLRHAVPSSPAWWPCLLCLTVATVGVNVVTAVGVVCSSSSSSSNSNNNNSSERQRCHGRSIDARKITSDYALQLPDVTGRL